jgi:hypothetical protein
MRHLDNGMFIILILQISYQILFPEVCQCLTTIHLLQIALSLQHISIKHIKIK